MEQGSSSAAKSPSNQRRMSFTDELSAIVDSSNSQNLPIETQSRNSIPEAMEYRISSHTRTPSQGETLTQFHGGNEDISAAYLLANLHPRQQLFHSMRGEEEQENDDQIQMMNKLTSSSQIPGLQIGSSQTLVPFERSVVDASMYNAYWAAQAQNTPLMAPPALDSFPLRPMLMRSQGASYQMNSTASALRAPFESPMVDPFIDVYSNSAQPPQTVESSFLSGSSSGARIPTSAAALKRKMPSQEEATPSSQGWNSSGRGFQRYNSRTNNNDGRYTLYDRRYEEVGLPVDPHLRIFIAANGNGIGESSSSKRND